ncbi:MAG: hypothetical protein GF329_06475 [Candidatus Lokiarchaeota archaeon]|nr:hypothetical protein [Candidatus Lokiarchaeota archaeon]
MYTASRDSANYFISIFRKFLYISSESIKTTSNNEVKITMKIKNIEYEDLKKMIIETELPTMGEGKDEEGNEYSFWLNDLKEIC